MPSSFLLRIGDLSSLTGVNIKTLRYYDEIGVLPPQYVNPENGYRYYAPRQALLVDLLRFCTLTGIPLKEFSDFVTPDGRIRYADLLAVGKKAAEARIQEIRRTLHLLRILEADMRRCNVCPPAPTLGNSIQHACTLALRPFDGAVESDAYHRALYRLMGDLRTTGVPPAYEYGLALLFKNGTRERHIFIEVEKCPASRKIPGISLLRIPATPMLHTRTDAGGIEQASDLFTCALSEPKPHLILATELFGGDVSMDNPAYELRCLPLPRTPRKASSPRACQHSS
ncbi:MAG TPA: MerR family DNA-binding transcriptional regulator [Candidatus Desulfovibrio intestinigallinarum]|nr:MerR family DNA-binding transcriptional regulator [Candidatus Desulfovibrio intestinigallinarum]